MLPSAHKLYSDANLTFQQELAPAQIGSTWFNNHSWPVSNGIKLPSRSAVIHFEPKYFVIEENSNNDWYSVAVQSGRRPIKHSQPKNGQTQKQSGQIFFW